MKPAPIYMGFALFTSSIACAGTMGSIPEPQRFYIEIGSGISFANQANPSVDLAYWSASTQGYNNSLKPKPLYTAGLGYTINDGLNIDVNYTFRGLYAYSKFQSGVSPSSVQNPLGARIRYMNLSSNAALFNASLDGGIYPALVYAMGNHGSIQPFVGAGLGVSYNTFSNFHTILASSSDDIVVNTSIATSAIPDQTKASLAYQFNAGLEWKYERFSFDVGYRYFNAGQYTSNNYLLTSMSTGTPVTTTVSSPWTGTLSANELFFTAKAAF